VDKEIHPQMTQIYADKEIMMRTHARTASLDFASDASVT
jgi:hypothetical protein